MALGGPGTGGSGGAHPPGKTQNCASKVFIAGKILIKHAARDTGAAHLSVDLSSVSCMLSRLENHQKIFEKSMKIVEKIIQN